MKTVFCPECKAPIKIVFKLNTLNDWVQCSKCGVWSYAIVGVEGRSLIRSLREIMATEAASKSAIEMFELIKKRGDINTEDLVFCVGKIVEKHLENFERLHMMRSEKGFWRVEPRIEEALMDEVVKRADKRDTTERFLGR